MIFLIKRFINKYIFNKHFGAPSTHQETMVNFNSIVVKRWRAFEGSGKAGESCNIWYKI